jgi:small subunit ribosomal protein S20
MPQRKNAIKALKVSETKRVKNIRRQKKVKTAVKSLNKDLAAQKIDQAREALPKTCKELDKAAAKGFIHANKAARLKSRLTKKVNAVKA